MKLQNVKKKVVQIKNELGQMVDVVPGMTVLFPMGQKYVVKGSDFSPGHDVPSPRVIVYFGETVLHLCASQCKVAA